MAGDDRPEDGNEDLFEDLDKFFEPIQDVGWPEEEPEVPAGAAPPEPEQPEVEPEAEPEVEQEVEAEPVPEPEPEVVAGDTQSFVFGENDAATGFEIDETDEVVVTPIDEPAPDDAEEISLTDQFAAADAEDAAAAGEDIVRIEDEDVPEIIGEGDGETVIVEEIEEPGLGSFTPGPEGEVEIEVELSDETEAAAEHFAASVRPEPEDVEAAILSDLESGSSDEDSIPVASPEGLQGPSWQEPTHEEVGEEGGRPLGRNVPAAFVTGLVMALVAIVALLVNKDLFAIIAGVVVILGQVEFYAAVRKRHFEPATAIGLVFGVFVLAGAYLKGEPAMLAMIPLCLVGAVLWEMATPAKFRKNVMVNISITMLGLLYVPLLAGFAMVVLALPNGVELIFAVLALTFIYDTSAFIIGSLWGDTQLAPSISPRKSVQGAVAATLIVIGLSMAFVSPIDGIGFEGAIYQVMQ